MTSGTILCTGGAGYIGSHTTVELLSAGWDVVVVDDFSNASPVALDRVREVTTGVPGAGTLRAHRVDIRDEDALAGILAGDGVDAVVHFAGLKAVGESVAQPLNYFSVNVGGSVALLRAMDRVEVRRLVFSSSCTVYGDPDRIPVDEQAERHVSNPYGRTKLMIEDILSDVAASDDRWQILALRYFNPVGAHASGRMGEDPDGIPDNLMPYTMQVATGRHPFVRVFGDDYPTKDGTGVRDYIHVVDLAEGHLAALRAVDGVKGMLALNLGTGTGSTVLEVIAAASRAVGRDIPYQVVDRRPGDIAATWCDPTLAERTLGWRAGRTLDQMAEDHWRWQRDNPAGYRS